MTPKQVRQMVDLLNTLHELFLKLKVHFLLALRNYALEYMHKEKRHVLLMNNAFQESLDCLDPDAPCVSKNIVEAIRWFYQAIIMIEGKML